MGEILRVNPFVKMEVRTTTIDWAEILHARSPEPLKRTLLESSIGSG